MGKRILYISDLPLDARARDLAREFERYGPIVRCDVPAPRRDARTSYAFVEYEDSRDAAEAYDRLHGKPYRGGSIRIEWAKRGPDSRREKTDSRRGGRGRSRSPRRTSRSRSPARAAGASPDAGDDRRRDRSASRSRSPRQRSASPMASPKMSDHGQDDDSAL